MVVGDVNIDVSKLSDCSAASLPIKYINVLDTCNFSIGNNIVTRPYSNTIIDHAAFVSPVPLSIFNSTINNSFSDHNIIVSNISLPNLDIDKFTYVTKTFVDYEKVNDRLKEAFQQSSRPDTVDVNLLYDYFLTTLQSAIRDNSKAQTKRYKTIHFQCKYMNAHLESLINERSNLIKRIKRRRNNVRIRNKIDILNVKISRLHDYYRDIHYEREFKNCDSPKQVWKKINDLLGKSKDVDVILIKGSDGNFIENDQVAQHLNDHFSTIGTKLANNIVISIQLINSELWMSPLLLCFSMLSQKRISLISSQPWKITRLLVWMTSR